jgi:hypothetical protein
MALLKRELYRQVKGPEVTHADRCTLVFETDAKNFVRRARSGAFGRARWRYDGDGNCHNGYRRLSQARRSNRWTPRIVAAAKDALQRH